MYIDVFVTGMSMIYVGQAAIAITLSSSFRASMVPVEMEVRFVSFRSTSGLGEKGSMLDRTGQQSNL